MSKKVVVIGGGPAGFTVAQGISKSKDVEVTLIDRNPAMQYQPASFRAVMDPTLRRQHFIPRNAKGFQIVQGEATSVADSTVTLQAGDPLPYDYLVIATGAASAFAGVRRKFTSIDQAVSELEGVGKAVENATKIVIVGGGPVGAEFASDIKDLYPDKKVTIVNSGPHVLHTASKPPLPESFCLEYQQKLEALGIEIINNDRVVGDRPEGGYSAEATTVTTAGGTALETDLLFYCIGTKVESTVYENFLPMEANGQVKVDQYLRVEGQENIFALGDCCNVEIAKMLYVASTLQAPIVTANITALAAGKPHPVKEFKIWKKPTMFLPLGRTRGMAYVGFLPIGGGTHRRGPLANMKNSQNIFLPMWWSNAAGRKMPSV